MKTLTLLTLQILLFGTSLSSASDYSGYPTKDWEAVTFLNLDSAKLKEFDQIAFDKSKATWNTDGVVVIYQGKLVYERYAENYVDTATQQPKKHLSWSMAKTVTAILFGIAQEKGIIRQQDTLDKYYGYLAGKDSEKLKLMEQVTLYNELSMTSGRVWSEAYHTSGAIFAEVAKMLYARGRHDMAAYTASLKLISPDIGHKFHYISGNTNIVMGALKQSMPTEQYNDFPWVELFDKIGMSNVTFEKDKSGTFVGGTSIYATPRDFARIGYLLLRGGKWQDEQIIPSEWLTTMTSLSPGFLPGAVAASNNNTDDGTHTYGAGVWLNKPAPALNIPKPFPDIPEDAFFAWGHEGQCIFVIPSKDLVVVRVAQDDASAKLADPKTDWNGFIKPLLQALPQ